MMVDKIKTVIDDLSSLKGLAAFKSMILTDDVNIEIEQYIYEKAWDIISNKINEPKDLDTSMDILNSDFNKLYEYLNENIFNNFLKNNSETFTKKSDLFNYLGEKIALDNSFLSKKSALLSCLKHEVNAARKDDLAFILFTSLENKLSEEDRIEIFENSRIQRELKEYKYFSYLKNKNLINDDDIKIILEKNQKNVSHSFKQIVDDININSLKEEEKVSELIEKNILNNVIRDLTKIRNYSLNSPMNLKELNTELNKVKDWKNVKDDNGASLYHHIAVNYSKFFNTLKPSELDYVLNLKDNKGLKPVDYFILNKFQGANMISESTFEKMLEAGINNSVKIDAYSVISVVDSSKLKADNSKDNKGVYAIKKILDKNSVDWIDFSSFVKDVSKFNMSDLVNNVSRFIRLLKREDFEKIPKEQTGMLILLFAKNHKINDDYGNGSLFEKIKGLEIPLSDNVLKIAQKLSLKYLDEYVDILNVNYDKAVLLNNLSDKSLSDNKLSLTKRI